MDDGYIVEIQQQENGGIAAEVGTNASLHPSLSESERDSAL
jgi:hypothetical protein